MPTWLIVFIVVVPIIVFWILVIPSAKSSNRKNSSSFMKAHPEYFRSPVRHCKKSYGSDNLREDNLNRYRDELYAKRYGASVPVGVAAGLVSESHQGVVGGTVEGGLAGENFAGCSSEGPFNSKYSMIPETVLPEQLYLEPIQDFVGRTMPGVEPEVLYEPQYSMIEGNIYHNSFESHGLS